MSNPFKTRVIAEAKIKTDKVDARVLAELLAADYLPSVWQADEVTKALRRQVGEHIALVRQRTRVKNQVQAILARNLLPRCPFSDLFGIKGRRWLADQALPADERRMVRSLLRQLDFAGEELKLVDAELARAALDDPDARRLMTIPGVDMAVAVAIVATVGDFSRFESPDKLVSYVGLNPSVRQSGGLAGHPWADLQAGSGVGQGHAGRGRPRRQPHPRTAPRVLRAGQGPAGMADRHRRGGPETVGDLLAHDPRPARLRLLPALPGGQEDPGARAACRGARPSRATGRARRGLQPQNRPRSANELSAEQAEAAYNHLTRNWQPTRPAAQQRTSEPATGSPAQCANRTRPGRQGCPCGRLRRP